MPTIGNGLTRECPRARVGANPLAHVYTWPVTPEIPW